MAPRDTRQGLPLMGWERAAMTLSTSGVRMALWCEVVRSRGNREWQARLLRWKQWPQ